MSMTWNRIAASILLLTGVIALSWYLLNTDGKRVDGLSNRNSSASADTIPNQKKDSLNTLITPSVHKIPDYVFAILNHILKYQEAPPRYVGGRIFFNREKKLVSHDLVGNRIEYKEWDVHPKVKGQNRGAERLITGSDHSAYYTPDHYQTFIKINP